jgi:GNAT superfamily N-acetyltransferase
MSAMVLVREITVDDWALMRDVRLTALSEAPYAFGSTYAREAAFTEEAWRRRINERPVTFFAHADLADTGGSPVPGSSGDPGGEPAGVAGVYVEHEAPDLVSMWVRPTARGLGVGEALVEAAASWAKAHDYPALFLWVTETNAPARRLYERCGFTLTEERQPLPSDPTLLEIRMSRML